MNDRLRGNILEPPKFTYPEVEAFIRNYRCSMCRGHLIGTHIKGDEWGAVCPTCEAPAYLHNVVKVYDLTMIADREKTTQQINRDRQEINPDQIMKELGF